jgi:hypothetical protein
LRLCVGVWALAVERPGRAHHTKGCRWGGASRAYSGRASAGRAADQSQVSP